MSLDKVNHWLTLLANVGVLAGIVFLALEMRHSSNAINAQTHDSIADGFIALNLATITDATVGIIWVTGLSDPASLSESEAIQFSMHMRALFNQFRRVHGLYKTGLLEDNEWALYAREADAIMNSPGGQSHWAVNEMNSEFKADLDRYASDETYVDFRLGREAAKAE